MQPTTILFVDDNPALLKSIERLLRMEGFSVLLATDGEEALRLMTAAKTLPDLIISDVAMPNMDGFQFFERVRQREDWISIPFLFLTARDEIDDLRQGYSLGADDYLVKPLDQERFMLVIRAKLKRRAEILSHIETQQHALDTAKHDLAQMVAHELRTPLVSINMVTEILSREIDKMKPDQVQDMLKTMRSGSIRLTRLIEQMVMFVQLQSGALTNAIQQHLRPSYIHDAVLGAIDRVQQQFSSRQREIPIWYDVLSPEILVRGDTGALRHALAELLSNAVAFSKPTDSIAIEQWLAEGMIWISITDQGPGIPEDELEHIFQPYRQSQRMEYEQQGVGIGLTLAKGIIEAHSGTLELRSTIGKGTQALVGLPVCPDDEG